jgi:putative flippase GtrA
MDSFCSFPAALQTIKQLTKYGAVGFFSNVAGYSVYLLLTYLGATPKLTMTLLYVVGVCVGFWGNSKYTFACAGFKEGVVFRYVVASLLGYLMNLSLLFLFVDCLGLPHQGVQAVAILLVAILLFVLFRLFVFSENKTLVVRE